MKKNWNKLLLYNKIEPELFIEAIPSTKTAAPTLQSVEKLQQSTTNNLTILYKQDLLYEASKQ